MSTPVGQRLKVKIVKLCIAIVGLIALRLILSALPMLKGPIVWMPEPSASTPGVAPAFNGDLAQLQALMANALGSTFKDKLPPQALDYLIQSQIAIFPITIAKAAIDTLIFVMLVLFGRDLSQIVRSGYARFPDLGQILNLAVLTLVATFAYFSYQGIFYPLLWPSNQDIYGWAFLVLGLAPVIGIALLVHKNMDLMTSAVTTPTNRAPDGTSAARCNNCGHSISDGATKFCPNCAAAVSVPSHAPVGNKRFCGSCGNENSGAAKFCGSCGQGMAG